MSTIQVTAPNFTADGANDYTFGSAQSGQEVAAWRVQLVNNSATFSASVKQKNNNAPDAAYVAVPYRKLYLNGAVGDGSFVSTDITDSSLLIVPGGGACLLSFGSLTGGTVDVTVEPMYGYSGI